MGATAYFTFANQPYNTSFSFAIQLQINTGTALLYTGVNTSPSASDPTTYLLSTLYNTTQNYTSGYLYTAQPVYIPASACSSAALQGQSCAVVFMASTDSEYGQYVLVTPMSAAGNVWLQAGQATTPSNATSRTTTYQFTLGSAPQQVTLAVNSSSGATVYCSYQYVTPTAAFSEWQWTIASSRNGNSSAQLSLAWGVAATSAAALPQLNANTPLAALPTTCYCSLHSTSAAYSIAYSTSPVRPAASSSSSSSSSYSSSSLSPSSPSASSASSYASSSQSAPSVALPSSSASASSSSSSHVLSSTSTASPAPSSDSSLSRGALVAAVVVPVLVVLLLLASLVLLCARRRGGGDGGVCCWRGAGVSKDTTSGWTQQRADETDSAPEVSMTELSSAQKHDRRLMQQQHSSEQA